MRKTRKFEGKRHTYDTETANLLGQKSFSYYGDPAGYEEQLFQTKAGLYFIYGQGGTTSPYAEGEDITPLSEAKAQAWLKEQPEGERA